MLSVGAIRFEDRFCASRKGGMRGGGWVSPRGMAAVVAGCRKALVNARWAIVLLSCTNGPRKHSFRLVGAPFLTF